MRITVVKWIFLPEKNYLLGSFNMNENYHSLLKVHTMWAGSLVEFVKYLGIMFCRQFSFKMSIWLLSCWKRQHTTLPVGKFTWTREITEGRVRWWGAMHARSTLDWATFSLLNWWDTCSSGSRDASRWNSCLILTGCHRCGASGRRRWELYRCLPCSPPWCRSGLFL